MNCREQIREHLLAGENEVLVEGRSHAIPSRPHITPDGGLRKNFWALSESVTQNLAKLAGTHRGLSLVKASRMKHH